jgi:hypothetical protein
VSLDRKTTVNTTLPTYTDLSPADMLFFNLFSFLFVVSSSLSLFAFAEPRC